MQIGGLMKFFLIFLSCSVLSISTHCFGKEGEENALWLIQEEFIKYGKKEAYEHLQSDWLKGFQKSINSTGIWKREKNNGAIYAIQVREEPQYMYLIPLQENGFSQYFQKEQEYWSTLSPDLKKQRQALLSLINFSMNSLHLYLKKCSHLTGNQDKIGKNSPNFHFWVYGIMPGQEEIFEKALTDLAQDPGLSEEVCWRVWRVVVGSDMPKYIILASASSENGLEEPKKVLKPLSIQMKEIIRNEKEGDGKLKNFL